MSDWNMENIEDFGKWKEDNKEKSMEGCDALKSVMAVRHEIAVTATLKWLRDKGGYGQEGVAALEDRIVGEIMAACKRRTEEVIRDSATIFAVSGEVDRVVMMATVSFAIIGVEVANKLIAASFSE